MLFLLPPLSATSFLLATQDRGQDAEVARARQAAVPGQRQVFQAPPSLTGPGTRPLKRALSWQLSRDLACPAAVMRNSLSLVTGVPDCDSPVVAMQASRDGAWPPQTSPFSSRHAEAWGREAQVVSSSAASGTMVGGREGGGSECGCGGGAVSACCAETMGPGSLCRWTWGGAGGTTQLLFGLAKAP